MSDLRLAVRSGLGLALFVLLLACAPGGGGAGGDAADGNTVSGTLQDAQSLSGQEIVRISIRTDDGTVETMDVDDPSLAGGGLTPAQVRERIGERVTVEFREQDGRRYALRVTEPAP